MSFFVAAGQYFLSRRRPKKNGDGVLRGRRAVVANGKFNNNAEFIGHAADDSGMFWAVRAAVPWCGSFGGGRFGDPCWLRRAVVRATGWRKVSLWKHDAD